jgi:UPF0755 protein
MPESLQPNVKRTRSDMVRFLFLLCFLGTMISPIALMMLGNRPLSTDSDIPSKVVRIPQGLSAGQIVRLLETEKIIGNPTFFRILLRLEGAETSLQAGSYLLNPGMKPLQVIEHLRSGRIKMERVVIPEGFEIKQIAGALADRGLADRQRFIELASDARLVFGEDVPLDLPIASLEGYLYPDTYHFHEGQTEEDIIRQMVERFISVTNQEIVPLLEGHELTLHEVTTLASIVEREVMVDDERTIVASVYLNRLAINMPLQADPTVRYVTPEERPRHL